MAEKVVVLVGTKKGLFIAESDATRRSWDLRGPYCEHWPINHAIMDPASGTIYAGGGSEWFGPAVWKSTDLGRTWTHSSQGLTFGEGKEPIGAVWSLEASPDGSLYAGVIPAALFRSTDGGETWTHLDGLQKHPTRPEWNPGGAGLTLHHIIVDPDDPKRIWVAISSAGVYYSADGGQIWEPRNKGVRADYLPEDQRYPEFGQCAHSIAKAPGMPDRLYQQNHCGMYRSDDAGQTWTSIEDGLPSTFGFPSAAHPTDPDTVFLLPLNGDSKGRYMPDAKAAVYRSRDGGRTWKDLRKGLPQENAYFGVLRQAMATDSMGKAGVYFGTSGGALFASNDEAESWSVLAEHLPSILSVETAVVRS
jgi:photosystem II stability/assembly factor-like uncharacterized protein